MSIGSESTVALAQTLKLLEFEIEYNDSQDLMGISEVFVMDVYRLGNLKEGDFVLDAGAGIGEFALLASKKVGAAGIVVAIEPNPLDFATLQRNMLRNACSNVVLVNCAVGAAAGPMTITFKGQTFTVDCRRLESLVDESLAGRKRVTSRVDVIKMDVEGVEAAALQSMGKHLNTSVRDITIELHGTREAVDRVLLPLGLTFVPFNRRSYLRHSVEFAIRHPHQLVVLLLRLKQAGKFPSVTKAIRGLDISRGESLQVGSYLRRG
jgi:FkbM family methyltransferase